MSSFLAVAVPAALGLLKLFLVPAVAWLVLKLIAFADAHAKMAQEKGKGAKAARILDSLAHFIGPAAEQEAAAVKAALDAGKKPAELGAMALSVIKSYLGQHGLDELRDLLGITVGGVEARLQTVAAQAVTQKLSASSGPTSVSLASPPVPAAK